MKTINQFLDEFTVTWDYLKSNFKLVKETDSDKYKESGCPNCGNKEKMNMTILPSESWTSTKFCHSCGHIIFTIYADHNGGNHSPDRYYIYEPAKG